MSIRRIDHERADQMAIAIVEQDKAMGQQVLQEVANDPHEASTVNFCVASGTLTASVGVAAYGAGQFVEQLRAALLELSIEASNENEDENT